MIDTLLMCMNSAISKSISKNQLENADSKGHGNEKLFYPFFNRELLKFLKIESIDAIGCGKIDFFGSEEIDCIIRFSNGRIDAIEIKGGPSKKSYLLSGSDSRKSDIEINFTDNDESLKTELKSIYDNSVSFCYDSQVGDIIKLTNILHKGLINFGYAIGLLIYADSRKKEMTLYKEKLIKMIEAIKKEAKNYSYSYGEFNNENLNVFITVVKIDSYFMI